MVGRHEAVVRTPWYLTSQYLSGKLGCPVVQAAQLADSFAILDADAAMVETFLGWVKVRGVDAALAYFSTLATAAAEAESVDPDDACTTPPRRTRTGSTTGPSRSAMMT